MDSGIYCYKDTLNNDEIVYVGMDSAIYKNERHRNHYSPSKYDKQVINRVLQNNPDRYSYHVLKKGEFNIGWLSALEILYIRRYSPKFNYTIGGETAPTKNPSIAKKVSDALKGRKFSKEHRRKLSEAHKGKKLSKEHREKMSIAHKGEKNAMHGKTHTLESKLKMSKARNTSGYLNVSKQLEPTCKQGFIWRYLYKENGKTKKIASVDLDKLKQKVLDKGLEWRAV